MASSCSGHGEAGGGRPVRLEELIALRDGELSGEQEAALLERLATDPEARELLDQLDETDAILTRLRTRPMPPDVSDAIQRRLAEESRRRDHGDEAT